MGFRHQSLGLRSGFFSINVGEVRILGFFLCQSAHVSLVESYVNRTQLFPLKVWCAPLELWSPKYPCIPRRTHLLVADQGGGGLPQPTSSTFTNLHHLVVSKGLAGP